MKLRVTLASNLIDSHSFNITSSKHVQTKNLKWWWESDIAVRNGSAHFSLCELQMPSSQCTLMLKFQAANSYRFHSFKKMCKYTCELEKGMFHVTILENLLVMSQSHDKHTRSLHLRIFPLVNYLNAWLVNILACSFLCVLHIEPSPNTTLSRRISIKLFRQFNGTEVIVQFFSQQISSHNSTKLGCRHSGRPFLYV